MVYTRLDDPHHKHEQQPMPLNRNNRVAKAPVSTKRKWKLLLSYAPDWFVTDCPLYCIEMLTRYHRILTLGLAYGDISFIV